MHWPEEACQGDTYPVSWRHPPQSGICPVPFPGLIMIDEVEWENQLADKKKTQNIILMILPSRFLKNKQHAIKPLVIVKAKRKYGHLSHNVIEGK